MPGTASNAPSFAGAVVAMLNSARSPKILNAGTLLRLASLKRHARNACSMRRGSEPDTDVAFSVFPDCVRAMADGDPLVFRDFFKGLRLEAGRTASFMTNRTGVVSLVARPDGVRPVSYTHLDTVG